MQWTMRVLLGRKYPLLKKKSCFVVLCWGSKEGHFFLLEKKKRQVVARGFLLALEQC